MNRAIQAILLWLTVAPSSVAVAATTWHAVPETRIGKGTEDDPWGVNQLITPDGKPGVALNAMRRGDTLWLAGGVYDFVTEGARNHSYQFGVLAPAATDCTIRSKPGEKAIVRRRGGLSPLAGTLRRDGRVAHRLRILGIEFVDLPDPERGYHGSNSAIIRIFGSGTTFAEGCEVAFCRLIGTDITNAPRPAAPADNHEGLRREGSRGGWYHHNEIKGFLGKGLNSSGIKVYNCYDEITEDNWIHGNNCGVYCKNHAVRDTYRRNLIVDNRFNGNRRDFWGPDFNDADTIEIYDNVFDGHIVSGIFGHPVSVHHNLFRDADRMVHHTHDTAHSWRVWNNILLTPGKTSHPWWSEYTKWPGDPPALLEFDYNIVVAKNGEVPVPTYPFQGQRAFTLAQFRAKGFEKHSRFLGGGLKAIFHDPADSSTLKAVYRTAGRDRDIIGPHDLPTVLDTLRYGPEALIELEKSGASLPTPPPPPESRKRRANVQ